MWVRSGGSLLLAVNHASSAWFSRHLVSRFGVDVVNSYTVDSVLSEYPDSTTVLGQNGAILRGQWLTYTRQNRMLVDHAITNGRGQAERFSRVQLALNILHWLSGILDPDATRPRWP